ncbi:MAG TPA: protein kinase [Kofleriaceae bacterium]|nr:protein kinase [Kofleriaceae bacterium]
MLDDLDDDPDFPGTQRFSILRRLGAGGMGVVYEAIDREHNGRVALKTFRPTSRDAVLRLKDEFRALQGVHHKNLVRLGELIEDAGQWFFTMELVDGVDILQHVLGNGLGVGSAAIAADPTIDLYGTPPPMPVAGAFTHGKLDEAKLRAALPQLVIGLDALHAAGKVHRDIKPPNVLVTRDDRVVILDFGLVHDLPRENESKPRAIVGTVAYMAPEQAAAEHVGTAADWYAVGVLLYEALTGRLPFDGSPMQVLRDKQIKTPPRPARVVPGVPADLDSLAMELLRPQPADRPTSVEILERLRERKAVSRSTPARGRPVTAEPLFVGRDEQLMQLAAASEEARGKSVAAIVRGESGVGKTQLVKHFLGTFAGRRDVLVLSGRCYERESVPYKAFDGIVDALTKFLVKLGIDGVDELLPERVAYVAQVFPVLRSVDAIAHATRRDEPVDPQQQRVLVFAAVRELFAQLAKRYRLILVIDDLQWTDAESLALLRELLRGPDAPSIFYLATLRPTDAATVPLDEIEKTVALAASVHDLPLGALSTAAADELVARLVRRMGVSQAVSTRSIAEEARGHPLFIQELLHHIADAPEHETPGATQLDDAIMGRVARLDDAQRRLIEIVSVAGRPLPQGTIASAASAELAELMAQIDALRGANLIKSSGARRSDAIEPYHDRIRQAVLARLAAPARVQIHHQLATALEAAQHPDPETLAVHWRDAGKPERAVGYALSAAEQATAAVAFARAARLYRMAIELGLPADDRRRVAVLLADALANDGQGPAAAQAYLDAVPDAAPAQRRVLTQRAAEQLLRAGHINEGLGLARTVLADLGMRFPTRPRGTLASLLYQRAALKLRGLRHVERSEAEVDPEELERIDACWTLALLGFVDTLRGADFGSRHTRRALAAGEPRRLARALAVEAVYASSIAHGYEPRAHELLELARGLADKTQDRYAIAFVRGSTAVVEHAIGNFRLAREHADAAERSFREGCTGVAWELDGVQLIALQCLYYEGKLAELGRRVLPILEQALQRGDLFCASSVQTLAKFRVHLFRDEPDEARRTATDAIASWDQEGFHLQHRHELIAQAEIDLYLGRGGAAYRRYERSWRALEKSLLLKAQQQRLELFDARARSATAAALERGADRAALLAVAERHVKAIERDAMPWSNALARLTRAGIAACRGDTERAVGVLREAVAALDTCGLDLHAAIARRILGEQLAGDEGRALVALADAWLAEAQVKHIGRATAMLAPGFATS